MIEWKAHISPAIINSTTILFVYHLHLHRFKVSVIMQLDKWIFGFGSCICYECAHRRKPEATSTNTHIIFGSNEVKSHFKLWLNGRISIKLERHFMCRVSVVCNHSSSWRPKWSDKLWCSVVIHKCTNFDNLYLETHDVFLLLFTLSWRN